MHILITDETNKEATDKVKFFIYGGLFVPAEKANALHKGIEEARKRYSYNPTDLVKFDTNVRPKHVSQEDATKLKQDVIELCYAAGCKFSVLVLHHNIVKKDAPEKKYLWSASHIIGHFNYFLIEEVDDYGLVLIDRLPVKASDQYLSDLFQSGLVLEGGKRQKLERIIGLSSTCIGASHLVSAIDVVLGTFRFCVNNLSGEEKIKTMLRSVARMLWYKEVGGVKCCSERGLIVRPKIVKVGSYKKDYDSLIEKIEAIIKDI